MGGRRSRAARASGSARSTGVPGREQPLGRRCRSPTGLQDGSSHGEITNPVEQLLLSPAKASLRHPEPSGCPWGGSSELGEEKLGPVWSLAAASSPSPTGIAFPRRKPTWRPSPRALSRLGGAGWEKPKRERFRGAEHPRNPQAPPELGWQQGGLSPARLGNQPLTSGRAANPPRWSQRGAAPPRPPPPNRGQTRGAGAAPAGPSQAADPCGGIPGLGASREPPGLPAARGCWDLALLGLTGLGGSGRHSRN